MRVLIYGGRDFGTTAVEQDDAVEWLTLVLPPEQEVVVVSGGANGADALGEAYAKLNGWRVDRFPADWKTHGVAAGPMRNQQMVESGIDMALEFPGGRGTSDMRSRLRKAGVPIQFY